MIECSIYHFHAKLCVSKLFKVIFCQIASTIWCWKDVAQGPDPLCSHSTYNEIINKQEKTVNMVCENCEKRFRNFLHHKYCTNLWMHRCKCRIIQAEIFQIYCLKYIFTHCESNGPVCPWEKRMFTLMPFCQVEEFKFNTCTSIN